jgi:hypothetical protein
VAHDAEELVARSDCVVGSGPLDGKVLIRFVTFGREQSGVLCALRTNCLICVGTLFAQAEKKAKGGLPIVSTPRLSPHEMIFVRVGTFADPNLANPDMTIWTSSAPRWACMNADLPQVVKQPPPAA